MNKEDHDSLIFLLDERIRRISSDVFHEEQKSNGGQVSLGTPSSDDLKLAESLKRIMLKEFLSTREAALLLNCSDGHVRNLVNKAQTGKASYPIPFLDLDGVTVFSRVKLLEWAAQPKRKLRAVS